MSSISAAVIRATGTKVIITDTAGRELAGYAGLRQEFDRYGEQSEGSAMVTLATIAVEALHPDSFAGLVVPAGGPLAGHWQRGKLISSDSGQYTISLLKAESNEQ